jgi:hypothetical protein
MIPYTWKFSSGENIYFRHISPPTLISKNFIFVLCNDCIENMATFTALVEIFSTKSMCSTKIAGFGKL